MKSDGQRSSLLIRYCVRSQLYLLVRSCDLVPFHVRRCLWHHCTSSLRMDWWSRCTLPRPMWACRWPRNRLRRESIQLPQWMLPPELEFPFDIDTADDSMYVAKVRRARDGEDYPVLEARLPKAKVGPTSNMDLLCVWGCSCPR